MSLSVDHLDPNDTITLLLQDSNVADPNDRFRLKIKVLKQSKTLSNLVDDVGVEHEIPLPNITKQMITLVAEFVEKSLEQVSPVRDGGESGNESGAHTWEVQFCEKLDDHSLFTLTTIANFLAIDNLLQASTDAITNIIKGKTPEEILKRFDVIDNFTKEEREEAERESCWSEER